MFQEKFISQREWQERGEKSISFAASGRGGCRHPFGLQVQKFVGATTLFSSEGVSATRFLTCRPNGWFEKEFYLGGAKGI